MHMNYHWVCEEGNKGAQTDADEFWIDGNGRAHQIGHVVGMAYQMRPRCTASEAASTPPDQDELAGKLS